MSTWGKRDSQDSGMWVLAIVTVVSILVIAYVQAYPWTATEAKQKIEECREANLGHVVERYEEPSPWAGRIDEVRCTLGGEP